MAIYTTGRDVTVPIFFAGQNVAELMQNRVI